MVLGWRRAFRNSTPKDNDPKLSTTTHQHANPSNSTAAANTPTGRSPGFASRFNFFSSSAAAAATSNPFTPPATAAPSSRTPILRCRTAEIIDSTTTTTTITNTPPPSTSTPPPRKDHDHNGSNNGDNNSTPPSPTTLRCRIAKTPRTLFNRSSNPSSPSARSPSTFSLLKSNLGLSSSSSSKSTKSSRRCGICSQTTKPSSTSNRTAVFTAECSHAFHLSCLTHRVALGQNGTRLACPVCGVDWKDPPLLPTSRNNSTSSTTNTQIRIYNDDEPLSSPTAGARFNSIPESDENNCDDDDGDTVVNTHHDSSSSDFPGFHTVEPTGLKGLEVKISREAALISVSRSYHTYTAVLKLKTPPLTPNSSSPGRPPIDLVVAIDLGAAFHGKLQALKSAMRVLISSLTSNDRLSIVAFSATSKRLLALRRMTSPGRRSARRIVEALIVPGGGPAASSSCVHDALRKAAKVLQDRQEKNTFATLLLLSGDEKEKHQHSSSSGDHHRYPLLSSTSYSNSGIPLHYLTLTESTDDAAVSKCVTRLINVVASDLRLQLGFASGSAAGEISAVYSYNGRPSSLTPALPKLGDLCAEEEREILLEIRVPPSAVGSRQILTVRSVHTDPLTRQTICGAEQFITVPRPHSVRSSDPKIHQLRSLFLATRAVAESRRLADRGDVTGAYHLLTSTRALLVAQPSSSTTAKVDEFRRMVEVEILEVEQGRKVQVVLNATAHRQRRWNAAAGGVGAVCVDEKGDPLTPTSAWKAAEKLAKVAIMRKSMNRVSDLHGFEDARF